MLLCTGDLHGTNGFKKFKSLDRFNLTEEDYVIIAGDFGVIWHNFDKTHFYDKNQEGLKWLKNNLKCKILFVDGNHENFNVLENYPIVDFCAAKARKINDQVYQLMRGELYEIEGQKIWTIGGARSTDKEFRTEGVSWWRQEEPTMMELDVYREKFEKIYPEINYIISHECPSLIYPFVGVSELFRNNPYIFPTWLTDRYHTIKGSENFKSWIFGHMHIDRYAIGDFRPIYDDFIELR